MRLPSFICGILCIPAAFWLGRTIHGDSLGLVAATLVAVDPNMVDQSQQARMYTMLALVSMLALTQAIRLLGSPAVNRRPWIVLGALLAAQFWTNFGAIALWLGLALATATIVLADYRSGGQRAARARLMLRGMATAYAWAVLLSARGLWRMVIFATSDRGISTTTPADTLRAMWQGFEQITGAGELSWIVLGAALVGLGLLWRCAPASAYVLAATALVTLSMIYTGRSVHHMIAARYYTVLQPTMWVALAALPVLAGTIYLRVLLAGGLTVLLGAAVWQSTHVDRWVDVNTWRYARCASRWIDASRGPDDLFTCTPYINFRTVARYYGLLRPDDEQLERHLVAGTPLAPRFAGRTTWMQAYMLDPRAEGALRLLLRVWQADDRLGVDSQRMIDTVKDQGLTIVRLSSDRFEAWVYDPAADDFRPLESIAARPSHEVRAANVPARTPAQ